MHIGVLGLGAMGKAVAANVVRAGFQTTVWNRSPQPVAAGVTAAPATSPNYSNVTSCCPFFWMMRRSEW